MLPWLVEVICPTEEWTLSAVRTPIRTRRVSAVGAEARESQRLQVSIGLLGAFLARRGAIAPEDVVAALEVVRRERPRIGQLAMQKQLSSVSEVCDVLDRQLDSLSFRRHRRRPWSFDTSPTDLADLIDHDLSGCEAHNRTQLDHLLRRHQLASVVNLETLLEHLDELEVARKSAVGYFG